MGADTKIEWTDATWNPTVGCSIVSPGCTNCYAMKVAHGLERRFGSKKYGGLTKVVNGNAVWTSEVRLDEEALLQPLKWKRRRRIFVNSMSDLFHERLADSDIDRVFAVMALCPQHTFQILSKRAERMRAYIDEVMADQRLGLNRFGITALVTGLHGPAGSLPAWPLSNCWLGVSCERQQEADERIPLLLQTPAAVRFISAEPVLGPIDLTAIETPDKVEGERWTFSALETGDYYEQWSETMLGEPRRSGSDGPHRETKLDWVIVGGESGKNARPMHTRWPLDLRDQCKAAGVEFFFKQWGEYVPAPPFEPATHVIFPDGSTFRAGAVMGATDIDAATTRAVAKLAKAGQQYCRISRAGKKAAGRKLDGREHNEFPVTP